MTPSHANQRWKNTIVCGTSSRLIHELKRFGGIHLPNIRGQLSDTWPAFNPAVMPPYAIWITSRMNEASASLDGRDHFVLLLCPGKPCLCPSAVHNARPSRVSA